MALMPCLPDYIFAEKLGKGSYATVYKAYRKGEQREAVAIKCVLKSSLTKSSVDNLITEISILKKIKHEHIVELKDFQWDDTYIYLILEHCSGGDLSNFIRSRKRLSEASAHKFLQQLTSALKVLRQHDIAHMDLKPQNILLSKPRHPVLKLGDFGLAQYLCSNKAATSCRGSPLYMAPEILLKQRYDARVDLWSVGIIFYECLFGQVPFSSNTFAELAEKIKSKCSIEIPYGAQVSDKCRQLILGLLQRDPNKRISFDKFFNHPFIDLEHMATPESFTKGVNLVQKAVTADSEGKPEKAIKFYSKALEYLIPHIDLCGTNVIKRKEMRKKCLEYVCRAEEIKKSLQEKQNIPKSQPTTPDDTLSLREVINSKPDFEKGLFLAKQAENLVNKGCYSDASDIYNKALEIMVPAITDETGLRKDLLYTEVNKWLQKAEDLKAYQIILKQQKKLSQLNTGNESVSFNKSSENLESNCQIQ